MIPYPPNEPLKLRIWQQNACKSLHNTDYIPNQANPKKYNVFLIQELWFDHLGKSRGTPNWRITYPPTIYHKHHEAICSLILINTNIFTETYSILDIHSSNISTIRFKGEFGQCSLFNIYNDCTHNNTLNTLHEYLDNNGAIATALLDNHMDKTHHILKDMMEWTGGGLDWSYSHNSPFELTKLTVMDFTRTNTSNMTPPLHITSCSNDGAHTTSTIDNT